MMQTQLLYRVIYLIIILMFHAFCLLNKHRNNISNVGILLKRYIIHFLSLRRILCHVNGLIAR